MGAINWLEDTRVQSVFQVTEGTQVWNVKVTPDHPGGKRHIITCLELPGWSAKCAYAYPDERDNSAFQFWMNSRGERDAFFAENPQ